MDQAAEVDGGKDEEEGRTSVARAEFSSIRSAAAVDFAVLFLCSIATDHGVLLGTATAAFGGHAALVAMTVARRRGRTSSFDRAAIRWGMVPLLLVASFIQGWEVRLFWDMRWWWLVGIR